MKAADRDTSPIFSEGIRPDGKDSKFFSQNFAAILLVIQTMADKILFGILSLLLGLQYLPFIPRTIDQKLLFLVSAVATLPVIYAALQSIRKKKISVDLLASIALMASLIARQWTSAAFINLMLTSARIFEGYTRSKARAAIQGLLKLRPHTIKVKRDSEVIELPAEEAKVGDLIIIESGERIPVDGLIVQGEASIDQSSLTGESAPVDKKIGDTVFSSTLAVSGSLVVKTEKTGNNTTLEKIISLVEESQKEKSDSRTIAEKFSSWYIVVTLVGSVLLYIALHDASLVLSVLLVTCADDIAIAVPLAFFSAIGYAARRGVIVKGGNFLEALTKIKTMIVDKTGTLTLGRLTVQEIVPLKGNDLQDVFRIAAMTEVFSEHPAAKAILEYAHSKSIRFEKPDDFEEKPGRGIAAVFRGKKFFSGNPHFFQELGIPLLPSELRHIQEYEEKGFDVTIIGEEKTIIGFIVLADAIRPGVKEVIEKLRALGMVHWVMLTGDNEKVAKRVATELDIGEFHANLLPEQKVEYIKQHLKEYPKTAMIGDGANDAASLALADVGIAMGAIGSDAAIEAADIALMRDDISEIPEIVELGRYTLKIVHQDFLIWGITNSIGLALAFSHIVGPAGAAAYNFFTDFLPLVNSIRLFNLHLKSKL